MLSRSLSHTHCGHRVSCVDGFYHDPFRQRFFASATGGPANASFLLVREPGVYVFSSIKISSDSRTAETATGTGRRFSVCRSRRALSIAARYRRVRQCLPACLFFVIILFPRLFSYRPCWEGSPGRGLFPTKFRERPRKHNAAIQ